MLAWCLWLLGSWAVTLWLDSTRPAVRWMVFAALMGLMLLWPVFRLSQDYPVPQRYRTAEKRGPAERASAPTPRDWLPPALPLGRVLLDWLSLILVFQAVIWPLLVTAGWGLKQTLLLDAAVASWSLVTAALVAWGCRGRTAGHRATAMVLCLLLVLGEPAVLAMLDLVWPGPAGGWTLRVSPIQTIWALTDPTWSWSAAATAGWVERVAAAAAAGGLGWVLLVLFNRGSAPARD